MYGSMCRASRACRALWFANTSSVRANVAKDSTRTFGRSTSNRQSSDRIVSASIYQDRVAAFHGLAYPPVGSLFMLVTVFVYVYHNDRATSWQATSGCAGASVYYVARISAEK